VKTYNRYSSPKDRINATRVEEVAEAVNEIDKRVVLTTVELVMIMFAAISGITLATYLTKISMAKGQQFVLRWPV
jgi:hypothetical protein